MRVATGQSRQSRQGHHLRGRRWNDRPASELTSRVVIVLVLVIVIEVRESSGYGRCPVRLSAPSTSRNFDSICGMAFVSSGLVRMRQVSYAPKGNCSGGGI